MSYHSTLSHLRRINTAMEKNGKLVQPRKLDNSQFGMICPAECFDPNTPILLWNGTIKEAKDIPIEERNSEELSHVEGVDENNQLKKVLIYPKKSKAINLAFDVTPAKYVTGLITERGISEASSDGLKQLFKK